ncbi:MAG: hypothetical protein ACRCSF_03870 [Mycobacteriaceae bacterium]
MTASGVLLAIAVTPDAVNTVAVLDRYPPEAPLAAEEIALTAELGGRKSQEEITEALRKMLQLISERQSVAAEVGVCVDPIFDVAVSNWVQEIVYRTCQEKGISPEVVVIPALRAMSSFSQSVSGAQGYGVAVIAAVEAQTSVLAVVDAVDGRLLDHRLMHFANEPDADKLIMLINELVVSGADHEFARPQELVIVGGYSNLPQVVDKAKTVVSVPLRVVQQPESAIAYGVALAMRQAAGPTAGVSYSEVKAALRTASQAARPRSVADVSRKIGAIAAVSAVAFGVTAGYLSSHHGGSKLSKKMSTKMLSPARYSERISRKALPLNFLYHVMNRQAPRKQDPLPPTT